jgi:uncharacterized phage-associated protein
LGLLDGSHVANYISTGFEEGRFVMPHSPEAVANEFLKRAKRGGIALTPMHLQKLVYIAHGWTLAITGRPLVGEQPQAWLYGPVYSSLYDALRRFGSGRVSSLIHQNNWANAEALRGSVINEQFSVEETGILNKVYEEYGDLEAFQLSALTHDAGTPWTETYVRDENRQIPNDLIERHFRGIAAGQAV